MRSAYLPHPSGRQRVSLRRRAISLGLALIANGLLLLMLFTLAPTPFGRPDGSRRLVTVQLTPDVQEEEPVASAAPQAKRAMPPPTPRVEKPDATRLEQAEAPPLNMIIVTKDVFAAADIANLPQRSADAAGVEAASGAGASGDTASTPGGGPNGERLYAAEWYREPTDAELGGYMPANIPPLAWAMIACRTVANYRVEDCAELGQSPAGSGLARAVRQAAWQFRVLPPRIGGRRLVGEWVRIRIDFTRMRDTER